MPVYSKWVGDNSEPWPIAIVDMFMVFPNFYSLYYVLCTIL